MSEATLPTGDLRSARILIVEDENIVAADIEETLRRFGLVVAGKAASGRDAIARAEELRPDLILMDIRLRDELDGVEAARQIRERQDVPVVFLTAYADEATLRRAADAAPFGYVLKPFDDRDLYVTIVIALSRHRAFADLERRVRDRTEALQQSEERFRLMVDAVHDYAILMLDPEGRVVSWNSGAERIKGYRAEEIIGQSFARFYPPEDVAAGKPERLLAAARAGGRSEDEGWRRRADGSVFWASAVISAVRDSSGGLIGFAKVTRDISERKRREEALRFLAEASRLLGESLDSDRTLASIARLAVPDLADWCAVHLIDPTNGQVRCLSVAHRDEAQAELATRVLQEHAPQPVARHGPMRAIRTGQAELVPRMEDGVAEEVAACLGDPQAVRRLGLRSFMSVPLVSGGKVLGAISFGAGASRRQYQQHDLDFARELAERTAIGVENARLYLGAKVAIQRAEEAIRVREEFLSIAAHELKTPLTPLKLHLESLEGVLARAGALEDPRNRTRIEAAKRQTHRLARLVENLLDVSRISDGRIRLSREEVDLADLVRDLSSRYEPEARGARVEVVVNAPDPVVGLWDRLRIEQIFVNLLTNAIKYGAGHPVTVSVRQEDGVASLVVEDRGIGISGEDLTRLFQRFERAVPIQHYGGLGLGLYITRQIVAAHGGKVSVRSNVGSGARFEVQLPVVPVQDVNAEADAAANTTTGGLGS